MHCLYFDCFSGISGDMTLGALIDLGVPASYLKSELAKLKLTGYTIQCGRAMRSGISARSVRVKLQGGSSHHHRTYGDIEKIISKSTLSTSVKERSIDIFKRIAAAEAKIHNKKMFEVHFHEAGALDSIVDIAGCAVGVDYLNVRHCFVSEVPLGSGTVECQHGSLPVPAPATLKILEKVPVYPGGIAHELVTPTGAAVLASFAEGFGPLPPMIIERTGYGAGGRDFEKRPNVLRLIYGRMSAPVETEYVRVLEASIDDMNPEWAGYLMERLYTEGALDVSFIPAQMKKNRPGLLVTVVCSEENSAALTACMLSESTTAGVRTYRAGRTVLPRRTEAVKTKYGSVQVKVLGEGTGKRVVPEFEECRRVALKKNVPLISVYEEIIRKS